MSAATLSRNDRRAIAIGSILVIPALLYIGVLRPFDRALTERRTEVSREQDLLARERSAVARAPQLPPEIAARKIELAAELQHAITSDAPATAAVRLASYVRDVARAHNVMVVQANELAPDSLGTGLKVVRLSLRSESDIAGVSRFLRALETGPMHVRVATLQIERNGNVRPSNLPAPPDGLEILSLSVTIEAPAVYPPENHGGAP